MVDNIKQICVELANLAKRKHYFCEDSWYSCPKAEEGCANDAEGDECTCGADAHNAKVNELLAAALVKPEEPVVGELVVVAHWGDFDYPMDAVRLGRLRETQEQDGKTYYYVDDLRRGFQHCRTLTPRVLPVKEAANASITTPSTHHPATHD